MILAFISQERYSLASMILQDADQPYPWLDSSFTYDPELDAKLQKLRATDVDPVGILRLESVLLNLNGPDRKPLETEFAAEWRKHLVTTYLENRPESELARVEIVLKIAGPPGSPVTALDHEIAELAARFDPRSVLTEAGSKSDEKAAFYSMMKWDLLCRAACDKLRDGDSTHFLPIIEAVNERAELVGDKYDNTIQTAQQTFLENILPGVCFATGSGKTAGFDTLVEPLAKLSIALSKLENFSSQNVHRTLAVTEFLAYWVGKPDSFRKVLSEIDDKEGRYAQKFSFPRHDSNFNYSMRTMGDSIRTRSGIVAPDYPETTAFLHAILTHPPAADLLPSDTPLLDAFRNVGMRKEIDTLTKNLPENLSQGGKALLLYYDALDMGRSQSYRYWKAYHKALPHIPPGEPWNHMRSTVQSLVVYGLLDEPSDSKTARTIFESIKPDEVSKELTTFYKSLPKRLKDAETREKEQAKKEAETKTD